MFKAVKSRKIRLGEGLEEVRVAHTFKLNEDLRTAAVLSRLLYMPSDMFSELLLPQHGASLGKIEDSTFWPSWQVASRNGQATRVEPDLHVEFENLDLIVEAKREDEPRCQTPDQWAREWAAWHQREDARPGIQPLLLGIGGLGATDKITKAVVTEIVRGANRILQTDFPGVPEINSAAAAGLSWQELYERLTSERFDDQLCSQLVRDLREILDYFGFRRYQYFGDLAGTMGRCKIDTIGLDSLVAVDAGTPHDQEKTG